jgi:hypothetical protein
MKTLQHIFFFLVIAGAQTFAQSNSIDSTFYLIESLFESGSYVNAEVEARRLVETPAVSDSVRVVAEKWIAFSLVAQGKSSLASDHFAALLKLNPQFELDPILTSPKILAVFNEIKAHLLVHVNPGNDTVAVRSFRQSMEVSFRTIVFPGWEQIHTGRSTAGYLFLGGGIGTLGAGIAFEALRSSARSEYLSATTASTISAKYSTYNKYYKAEAYAFSAFAVIYIASEIDVFGHSNSASFSFEPSVSSNRSNNFSLSIKF